MFEGASKLSFLLMTKILKKFYNAFSSNLNCCPRLAIFKKTYCTLKLTIFRLLWCSNSQTFLQAYYFELLYRVHKPPKVHLTSILSSSSFIILVILRRRVQRFCWAKIRVIAPGQHCFFQRNVATMASCGQHCF